MTLISNESSPNASNPSQTTRPSSIHRRRSHQVRDQIHQAGSYVDVDTADRTIQKKVILKLPFRTSKSSTAKCLHAHVICFNKVLADNMGAYVVDLVVQIAIHFIS
uniref:Uncharacterized protein n=1 Tax=Davidia involucrata TaxID=16924 RepID=A0A5B7B4R3_DAVIN